MTNDFVFSQNSFFSTSENFVFASKFFFSKLKFLFESRLYIEKKIWNNLKKKIELNCKILNFRYFKFTHEQVEKTMIKCIEKSISKNDVYVKKNVDKMLNNISNWKFETLLIMKINFICNHVHYEFILTKFSNFD